MIQQMQLGKLSIVCICLHTYVGCRSETVSETCIDCSRVTESACDCGDKENVIHSLPHNATLALYSQIITNLYL